MAKTTSVEGIETVLEKVYESEDRYDLIIIDYYQKIGHSIKNPKLGIYESQERFVNFLDEFKNRYPAPILLLAQVNKESKHDQKPFKDRIEGRKVVLNIATVAIELVTDHQACRTDWIFHKSRFSGAGVRLSTGWDRGLYVSYTDEFKADVAKKQIDAALKKNKEA